MIRVFVGCAANNEDAESCCVLEHSIRSRSSLPVSITWMRLSSDPTSPFFSDGSRGWRTDTWATPFSGFRWAVPDLCSFEGKAIYCDSDVIFLADIAELWGQEFESGKVVMAKGGKSWRLCVSLWDCAAAAAYVKQLSYLRSQPGAHQEMIARFKGASFVQEFAGQWNYCDNEDFGPLSDAKVVHYTDMATQPHLRYAIPRLAKAGRKHWFNGKVSAHPRSEIVALFDREFEAAKAAGYTPDRYEPEIPFGDYRKRDLRAYGARHRAAA